MSPSAVLPAESSVQLPLKQDIAQHLDVGYDEHLPDSSYLAGLDASNIRISLTQNPRAIPALDSEAVQNHEACTDHMITVTWTQETGWAQPCLIEYGPISLMPASSVLHYATECFEGMKVYRGFDGTLRLFRPMHNCHRMVTSAARISLPTFNPEELLQLIKKLCAVECPKWLPKNNAGSFLYIRPMLFSTDTSLGMRVPRAATLIIFLVYWPVPQPSSSMGNQNPYKPAFPKGLRLLASREDQLRAWPGGTGFAKIGANYGPSLLAHGAAHRQGFDQVLWLYGKDCRVTEAGGCNFFVIWRSPGEEKLQMITAPLDDGMILAGVTRQSILELAKERFAASTQFQQTNTCIESLEVLEQTFTMSELVSAWKSNRLLAAFAVGTAYFVNPVSQIQFGQQTIDVETEAVPHVGLLRQWLSNIMYGNDPSLWVEDIDEQC